MTRALYLVAAFVLLAAVLFVVLAATADSTSPTPKVATTSATTVPGEVRKQRPDPADHQTTTTARVKTAAKSRRGAPFPTDRLLDALAYCETGGTMNPATNTGNGYYGAFQFAASTWNRYRQGYAHQYPYEVQRDVARQLILDAGWSSQFPVCSRVVLRGAQGG